MHHRFAREAQPPMGRRERVHAAVVETQAHAIARNQHDLAIDALEARERRVLFDLRDR